MSKKIALSTILASLVLTAGAGAETKAPPKAPAADKLDTKKMASTPAPELASMTKFFTGTWHCEGKITPAPGLGKTFNGKSNTTWALALDGFWLGSTGEGEKVPGQPLATVSKGESRITYDRTAKAFVSIGMSNRGAYSVSTSKGWEGDKLAWAGSTSGLMKTETRATITKKSDTEYTFVGERMEAGKWVTGAEETCKKK